MQGSEPWSVPALADRAEELASLCALLEDAVQGKGRLVLVNGEPGVGKTRLAQEFAIEARARGFTVGFGTGLTESVVVYHPWSEALRHAGLLHLLDDVRPPRLLAAYLVTNAAGLAAEARRSSDDVSEETFRACGAEFTDFVGGDRAEGEGIRKEGDLAAWTRNHRRMIVRNFEGVNACAVLEGRESEPFLADLHELAVASRGAGDPRLLVNRFVTSEKYGRRGSLPGDPELRRSRLFENVLRGLMRRSTFEPTLLVFDDLQWADPSSLSLLHYVARNTKTSRVILVGTYRTEAGATRPHLREAVAGMAREGLLSEMPLVGLAREYIRDLATSFLGAHRLPEDFLDLLWSETKGNPLFVREVLRGLEAEGMIRVRGGAKRLGRPSETINVPQRVRSAIRARLARLPRSDRALLEAAAACGTRFTAALVAKVTGEDGERVDRTLKSIAQVHGLLQATASGYVFNHPEVQAAVYGALSPEVQRNYHREAAEWLELAGGLEEDIAEHYYLARDARAVPKLRKAAAGAFARYANLEAARLLSEALELAPLAEKASLLELRSDALDAGGKFEAALDSLRESLASGGARDRCLRKMATILGKMVRYEAGLTAIRDALRLAVGEERGRLYLARAVIDYERGQLGAAVQGCKEAIAILDEKTYPLDLTAARYELGRCLRAQGNSDKALGIFRQVFAFYSEVGDRRGMAKSLHAMGVALHNLGRLEEAFECYERSLAWREAIGDRDGVISSERSLGVACADRGDHLNALRHYERGLSIEQELGATEHGTFFINIAHILLDRGDLSRASELFEKAREGWEAVGDPQGSAVAMLGLAGVHLARGELRASRGLYERSLGAFEKVGTASWQVSALAGLGYVFLALGEPERALAHFERGLVISEGIRWHEGRGRSLTGIGIAREARGELDPATEALESAVALWAKMGRGIEHVACHAFLSQSLSQLGRNSEARKSAEKAISLAGEGGWPRGQAMARRALALCDAAEGRGPEARASFQQVIEILRGIGAAWEVAETHFRWGLAERQMHDSTEARKHLEMAARGFRKTGATKRAAGILSALERPNRTATSRRSTNSSNRPSS